MKTLIPLLVCGLLAVTFGRPTGPTTAQSAPQPTGPTMPGPTAEPYPNPFEGCSAWEIAANFDMLIPAVMHVVQRNSEKSKKYFESKLDIECDDHDHDEDEEEEDEHKEYMALMKDMSKLPAEIIDYIDYDNSDVEESIADAVKEGLDCDDSCKDKDCARKVAWKIMHAMEKHRMSCRTSVAQKIVLAVLMRATESIVDIVHDPNFRPDNVNRTIKVLVKTARVLSKRIRRKFTHPQRRTFESLTSALARGIHSIMEDHGNDAGAIIDGVKGPISRAFQCVPEGAMTKRVLWAIAELEDLFMQPAEWIVYALLPRFLPPCAAIEQLVGIDDPVIDELKGAVINGTRSYQYVMHHVLGFLEVTLLSGNVAVLSDNLSGLLNANETALFEDALSGWDPTRCS